MPLHTIESGDKEAQNSYIVRVTKRQGFVVKKSKKSIYYKIYILFYRPGSYCRRCCWCWWWWCSCWPAWEDDQPSRDHRRVDPQLACCLTRSKSGEKICGTCYAAYNIRYKPSVISQLTLLQRVTLSKTLSCLDEK